MLANLIQRARRTPAFLLLGLLVAPAAPAQANPPRPYKAAIAVHFDTVTPLGGTLVQIEYTGIGNGTHVGHYVEKGSFKLDLATGVLSGSATVTAADESTFTFKLDGGPGVGTSLVGKGVLTGGTGRFSGAKGTLYFTADQT